MKIKNFDEYILEKNSHKEYWDFVKKMNKDYSSDNKKTFLEWWKAFFTIKEKGIERYDDSYIRKVSQLPFYPSGLDTENCELCYIDKEKAVVSSGGDWQNPRYLVIKLGNKHSGDLPSLEIDEVLDKNPYKQTSNERKKFKKENDLISSSKFDKNQVNYSDESKYNGKKCKNCKFKNSYNDECRKVEGDVDINGYCKLYKMEEEIYETFTNKVVIGIDIDSTINNVPDKKNHKAEMYDLSLPYSNAVVTVNNIYDFIKTYGFELKIVTCQPSKESEIAAEAWLNRFGFEFDEIVFVENDKEKWNYADIMVDDSEKVIGTKPLSKVSIKINQEWNENINGDINIPNISDLTINIMKDAILKLKNKTTI